MPRIFLGNFDFEHELARSRGGVVGGATEASARFLRGAKTPGSSEFAWTWTAVAESADFIITPAEIDPQDLGPLSALGLPLPHFLHRPGKSDIGQIDAVRDAELVPWGWTDSMADLERRHGWKCRIPPMDAVYRANSRVFRFELERDWEIGLPGSAIVTSLDELAAVLQGYKNAPHGWVLKANFGMSGREALRGRGTTINEKTWNWARRRLASAGPIVVEPVVERIAEAGIQIEIPTAGPPQLVGVTPLVDRSGVYRGSRFACPADEIETWQPAIEVALRVARVVHGLGYFGPLGIDAMQFRDESGQVKLRPLQDLNARWTMGRLALGFRRIVPAGWCGTWRHFSSRLARGRDLSEWNRELQQSLPREARVVAASPAKIGSQLAEHHAVLVLAPTPEIRNKAEAAIFTSLGPSSRTAF